MDSNLDGISIINLNAYTTPKIEEVTNADFVSYGENNMYFNYLIDRYINSTTNQAIIKGTATKIFGKGLDALDSEERVSEWDKVEKIISHKCLRKIAFDRKLLGMSAMQVTYLKGKVNKITHFPMETLRAGKMGDSGKVEKWYYHPKWEDYKKSDKLKEFPVFGSTNQKKTEIYILSPYTSGFYYYPPVDYAGALPYAYLEEVISEYLINDALNGFSGTKVINLNNGVPDKETQRRIKHDINSKLTGQLGDKVVVSFNNNKESATTVENLPLDNAPEHYQYLADECRNKLITGHNVTSPLLLGVRDGNGFSSNADEIQNSSLFYNNTVVKVYQDEITEALEEILAINKLDFELYFKTIQPLEFIDTENMDEETAEEETGIKDEKDVVKESNLSLSKEGDFTDELIGMGESLDASEWFLIDSRDVDYDNEEELDAEIAELNNPKEEKLSIMQKLINLASTGTARPNSKSEQDKEIEGVKYKVRYKYTGNPTPQREFCKKMMGANKLYRKEDIIAMGTKAVNAGFGIKGADTYSIWEYKGGPNCHHKWQRMTFKSTSSTLDTKSPNAPTISTNKAESEGYRVRNPKNVSMMPKDMPTKGYYKG
jgi:hypothetical protein